MRVFRGRIQGFLHGHNGETIGFILDGDLEVRILPAQWSRVSTIAKSGSLLEIHGCSHPGPSGRMQIDATAIINSDSNRIVYLQDPLFPHDPEVPPSFICATEKVASLDPPLLEEEISAAKSGNGRNLIQGSSDDGRKPTIAMKSRTSFASEDHGLRTADSALRLHQVGIAKKIEQAYSGLHRTQALLPYIKILNLSGPRVGRLLDEAKLSYEQALSTYQRQDFTAASEFASASSDLSLAVQIIISRTIRTSTNWPTLVPLPPEHAATSADAADAQRRLVEVEKALSRLRWILENGTMPNEEVEEVQKITSWSDVFLAQAQRMLTRGNIKDAIELGQAAHAISRSAEHRCKTCYVAHESDSDFAATLPPSQ